MPSQDTGSVRGADPHFRSTAFAAGSVTPGGELYDLLPVFPDLWTLQDVRLEILNWLGRVGSSGSDLYRQTVLSWKRHPRFKVIKQSFLASGDMLVLAGLSPTQPSPGGSKEMDLAALYTLIDYGAGEHWIGPKEEGGFLFWSNPYAPKTAPSFLMSFPGLNTRKRDRTGNYVKKYERVKHPGVEPRGFSISIALEMQRKMAREIGPVLQAAIAKGGAGPKPTVAIVTT